MALWFCASQTQALYHWQALTLRVLGQGWESWRASGWKGGGGWEPILVERRTVIRHRQLPILAWKERPIRWGLSYLKIPAETPICANLAIAPPPVYTESKALFMLRKPLFIAFLRATMWPKVDRSLELSARYGSYEHFSFSETVKADQTVGHRRKNCRVAFCSI